MSEARERHYQQSEAQGEFPHSTIAASGERTDTRSGGAHTPTDIKVGSYSEFTDKATACWQLAGAKFHVWFNVKTMAFEDVIYKNSLAEYGEDGYFETRKLDRSIPKNAAIVARVFAEIAGRGLVAERIAAHKEQLRIRAERNAEFARQEQIKEAGLELFRELTHLVRLLEPLEQSGSLNVPGLATLNGARAALLKASGQSQDAATAQINQAQ